MLLLLLLGAIIVVGIVGVVLCELCGILLLSGAVLRRPSALDASSKDGRGRQRLLFAITRRRRAVVPCRRLLGGHLGLCIIYPIWVVRFWRRPALDTGFTGALPEGCCGDGASPGELDAPTGGAAAAGGGGFLT